MPISRIAVILCVCLLGTAVTPGLLSAANPPTSTPNILLISVDDLNDWVGCLGGHRQAKTPHIDSLAGQGILFTNAHCQAPVCQPSRCSTMTSRYPSSTGLYFLNPDLRGSPVTKDVKTLPERFAHEGYTVMAAGKLFHHRDNKEIFGAVGEYAGNFGTFGPIPKKKISQPHGHPLWDWGAYPESNDEMPDFKIAHWAMDKLKQRYEKPFFLAVGFYRPHVPMFVPQEWYDQHPRNKVQLPAVMENDRADIPQYALDLTTLEHVAPTHQWVRESGQWQHAVQSYLAAVTFVDDCVGKVIDALKNSPYRDNTLIVLFSDHGFHLGEKQRWAKRSLWEDGTRVPLIFVGPGLGKGQHCDAPVGLIDIYPTLLGLCGFEADAAHEGHSLTPLLNNTNASWDYPAMTTFGPSNHAVRSRHWRYIHYVDGSQELYDHRKDPHEWHNVAADPCHQQVVKDHSQWLPQKEHAILGKNSTGHLAYAAAAAALQARTSGQ